MKKIWSKNENLNINKLVEDYTVGIDYLLDMELIPYDIRGSKAHAQMLYSIGILNKLEKDTLIKGLNKILKLYKDGKFKILKYQEDGHTAIESFLIETYGEIGKKIHTGRSRNDQILIATRLFTLDRLDYLVKLTNSLVKSLNKKIKDFGNVEMPGYTHMQRAMPSSVGMWLGSIRDAIKDDLLLVQTSIRINNQNPLGSVVGFGEDVFNLDRNLTTKLLGIKKVQENPMYCAYSRGKFENIVLQSLSHIMMDLGKFASDLVLFSTKEFNFFTLPDNFKTGSSAMPQKKNWDVMELVRGNSNLFLGYEYQIKEVFKNLTSGYNRDFQLTKEPYLKGIKLSIDTIKICDVVIKNLGINKESLKKACSEELYATKKAYELVKGGMSFRDAYKIVGKNYI